MEYQRVVDFDENILSHVEQKETIYINVNNRKLYRWDDTNYEPLIMDENVIIETTKDNFTTNNIPINTLFVTKDLNISYIWNGVEYKEVEKQRIFEFGDFDDFPLIGETGCVYIDKLNNTAYRYQGNYILLGKPNIDEYIVTVENSIQLPNNDNPGLNNKLYITSNNNYLWKWNITTNTCKLLFKKLY